MFVTDRRGAWSILLLVIVFVPEATAQSRAGSQPDVDRAIAEARKLLAANELTSARARLEAALAENAASPEAHYLLGVTAEGQNDLSAASSPYQNALRLDPTLAHAHDRLGFVLGRLGRTIEALAAFERAVRLAPDFFDARYHLGAT